MVLQLHLAKRFMFLLLRNYVIAALIAVLGLGGAFLFLASQMDFYGRAVLSAIGVFSLLVMFAAELTAFYIQFRPIRRLFNSVNPTITDVASVYRHLRLFPLYSVLRIMGPHWLGIALPGLSITWLASKFDPHLHVSGLDIFIEFIASFCVAAMHALLEFFMTVRVCQDVLQHVNEYAIDQFHQDLNQSAKQVLQIRQTFIVSAILIGTLPLLLFSVATEFRLVYSFHIALRNYLSWASFFLIAGVVFSAFAAILIARNIELPVANLKQGMEAVTHGDLDMKVTNIYIDEFSSLFSGFNTMVQFLNERDQVNAQLLESFLTTLSMALDARDPYTAGHSVRVARYAVEIAKRSGLSPEDVTVVRSAGILHDVGKIGVADYVLLKEDRLTDEEFAAIQRHPVIGEQILLQIEPKEQIAPILPGVRSHHERYDGRGYPDGLEGEQIPWLGRLLAVADAFDAMTSDRPYRKGMTTARALQIIEEGAGTQWDPNYAKVFIAYIQQVPDVSQLHPEDEKVMLRQLIQATTPHFVEV